MPSALTVRHSAGSYPIVISSLREALDEMPDNARLVTDENVAMALSPILEASNARALDRLILAPGEASKSADTFIRGLRWLAQTNAGRQTAVVALGGGVIGDLAGFLAAAYMRGVPLIQIPTTLLAQVDSSVGGKVGIDLPEGKNLAGAFYPPESVHICVEVLDKLPEREVRNGMAEVLKYGFIADPSILESSRITPGSRDLESLILRCINIKADVVERDEHETTGLRAILNFGHTIGHAVEQATGYGTLLHGEAISIGMVTEAKLGEQLGATSPGTATEVERHLSAAGLPTQIPAVLRAKDLLEPMRRDKKATGKGLSFSLLVRVGECKLMTNVSEAAVLESLNL